MLSTLARTAITLSSLWNTSKFQVHKAKIIATIKVQYKCSKKEGANKFGKTNPKIIYGVAIIVHLLPFKKLWLKRIWKDLRIVEILPRY